MKVKERVKSSMQRNVKALCVDAFVGKTFEFGAFFSRYLVNFLLFICLFFSEKKTPNSRIFIFSMGRSVRLTTQLNFLHLPSYHRRVDLVLGQARVVGA